VARRRYRGGRHGTVRVGAGAHSCRAQEAEAVLYRKSLPDDLSQGGGSSSLAGAGYEHLSPTAYRFVEVRELA
jgi:hypothetical protein